MTTNNSTEKDITQYITKKDFNNIQSYLLKMTKELVVERIEIFKNVFADYFSRIKEQQNPENFENITIKMYNFLNYLETNKHFQLLQLGCQDIAWGLQEEYKEIKNINSWDDKEFRVAISSYYVNLLLKDKFVSDIIRISKNKTIFDNNMWDYVRELLSIYYFGNDITLPTYFYNIK